MRHQPVEDVLLRTDGGLQREDSGFELLFLGDPGVEVLCHVGRLAGGFPGPSPV